MTLTYHQAQIDVQTEANTRPVAEALRDWVGPVIEFCETADMIVLATPAGARGDVRFLVVSGEAPVVEIVGPGAALVALDEDSTRLAGWRNGVRRPRNRHGERPARPSQRYAQPG